MKKNNLSNKKIFTLLFICVLFSFPLATKATTTFGILRPINSLGLLGYWTFDGKNVPWTSSTAATALDTSGNNSTGTLTNMAQATSPTIGKVGQGLNFDGVDDYVIATKDGTALTETTISLWVNPNAEALVTQKGIFQWANTLSAVSPFVLIAYVNEGAQSLVKFSMDEAASTIYTNLNNNTWSHLVLTLNSSNLWTGYLNGVSIGTYQDNATHSGQANAASVYFGNGYNSYFDGKIDDARVYNRALTQSEITQLYNQVGARHNVTPKYTLASSLLGLWTFDGKNVPWTSSTAATALDSSGNGNTGTLTNMAQATSPATGKIGQGLNFDGVNDYVVTPAISYGTNVITVSMWLDWANYANDDDLLLESSVNFNNNEGTFLINPNSSSPASKFVVAIRDGNYLVESMNRPSPGFRHFTFVINNSTIAGDIKMFVDGVEQATTRDIDIKTASGNFAAQPLYLMSRAGSSLIAAGKLDDLRIYNRELTANEILQLYNLTK